MHNSKLDKLWIIVMIFCLIGLGYFDLKILLLPDVLKVQYIPDDGFYYLTLARNFIIHHKWTFDTIAVTTGFHPLFAYLLTIIYMVFGYSDISYVNASIILTIFLTLFAFAPLFLLRNKTCWPFIAAICIVVSSSNFILNSVSIMEWPLVLIFSSWLYYYTYKHYSDLGPTNMWAFFILGILGSLARSDFGLIPAAILMGSLISAYKRKIPLNSVIPVSMSLIGAITGVIFIFIHNYTVSHSFIQSSALVKSHWSILAGNSPEPFVKLLTSIFIPAYSLLGTHLLSIISIITVVMLILLLFYRPKQTENDIMLISSIIAVLGYICFYSFNSQAIQSWYTANIIIPITIILTNIILIIKDKLNKINPVIVAVLICIIAANMLAFYYAGPPWPWQQGMYNAGKYLSTQNLNVGSWNAGIMGFYQGGHVVNLDGLVNDEIYPYIIQDNLEEYIAKRNITYILDFDVMINDNNFAKNGGHTNVLFWQALKEDKLLYSTTEGGWNRLVLYKIEKPYSNIIKIPLAPKWKQISHSMMIQGYALVSVTTGATLEFDTNKSFDIKFLEHNYSGIVNLYSDGDLLDKINLYSDIQNPSFKYTVINKDGLTHHYRIMNSGNKDPKSNGTEIWFDAILERN